MRTHRFLSALALAVVLASTLIGCNPVAPPQPSEAFTPGNHPRELLTLSLAEHVSDVAFTADGMKLAVARQRKVIRPKLDPYGRHGRGGATEERSVGEVLLYDLGTGGRVSVFPPLPDSPDGSQDFGGAGRIVFSPSGTTAACISSGLPYYYTEKLYVLTSCTVLVWDVREGRRLQSWGALQGTVPDHGHGEMFHDLSFSPDGSAVRAVITAGGYQGLGTVWSGDLGSKEEKTLLHLPEGTRLGAFSPDGRRFVSLLSEKDPGNRRAQPGGRITVWDLDSGKELLTLAAVPADSYGEELVTDSGGHKVALVDSRGVCRVWPAVPDQQPLTIETGDESSGQKLVMSPDGSLLATLAGTSEIITVWDLATGKELFRLRDHTLPVRGMAFSPDSTRLVSWADNTVKYNDEHKGEVKIWAVSPGR